MSISNITDILDENVIITSASIGTTSFLMFLGEQYIKNNKSVIFITNFLNREFIKENYALLYDNCLFFCGKTEHLFELYSLINELVDKIIIDIGDSLVVRTSFIKSIKYSKKIILSSQVRTDLSCGGGIKPLYSTVELKNKIYNFAKHSIWLRYVTDPDMKIRKVYIDIFNKYRQGNNMEHRFVCAKTKSGKFIEI